MTGQLITFPVRLYVRGARILIHAAEDVTGKAVMSTLRVAGAIGSLRPAGGSATVSSPAPARPAPPPRRSSVRPVSGPPAPAGARAPARPGRPVPTRSPNGGAVTPPPPPRPASTRPADLPQPDPRIAPVAREEIAPVPPPPPPAAPPAEPAIDLDAPTPIVPEHVSAEPVLVREEAEPGASEGAGAEVSIDEPWAGYAKLNARDVIARLPASTSAELAAIQLYEASHRKRQTVLSAVTRALAQSDR